MIKNFEYLLFKRFFFSKKSEGYISIISWFSLIGISLGVAVLIIVMSVMNGFRDDLISRIVGINGHINIFSSNKIINDKDLDLLKKNNDFFDFKFNAVIDTQGLIISKDISRGIFLRGIDAQNLTDKNDFLLNIKYGKIYNNNSNEILIGENLARSLRVKVGDNVKIAIPKSDKTIFGNIPRFKTLKIKGIFNLGMYEYDSSFAYVPTNIGRSLLLLKNNEYNNIEIFIKNPIEVENKIQLLKKFSFDNSLSNLYFVTWKDKNKSFLEALKVERNVMFLILVLIILIASMNIISGLVIFVKDKNADIGILRTIGMSKFSLIKVFILIGSFIGFVGTILGICLGILFCINISKIQLFLEKLFNINLFSPEIYFLSTLPARIDYLEVVFIAFVSLTLTTLSTIYPAIKSSKVNPIKSIRNE